MRGMQARQLLDSDHDGKPDMSKIILRNAHGDIEGAQVDQNLDGQPDYKERYEGQKILRETLSKTASGGSKRPVP